MAIKTCKFKQFLVTSLIIFDFIVRNILVLFTVMVLKRHFGQEGSDDNDKSSASTKFQKVVKYVMKEASLQELAEKISIILEPTLRRVIKEELEQHISACFQSSPRPSLVHQPESYSSRGLQLIFTKKLPSTIFTNSRIDDKDDHAPLEVQLVDANSKNVIHNAQLSSIKVEIVALNGDFAANGRENWDESEFNDNIVCEREGKRPLLIGELSIVLVNGVGCLGNVTFTDNSSWIRSRKFKLGVRVLSNSSIGVGIKEALSEAFVVLDHRGESYQKHSKPSLDDPVWRLRKISKVGASRKKLESHGVKTVKDFLMHYYTNPSSLQRVLGKGVANRAWDTVVRHANDCILDSTHYRYCHESESVELLFNCVYKVVAVKFTGQDYQTLDSLDSHQKALVEKLKQSAYLNLNDMIPVHSAPVIEHNIPLSSLDLQNGDFSMIEQFQDDQPAENQLDFNLSDTASYPCTVKEGSFLQENDSTSQTDQFLAQSSFMTGDSSSIPSNEGYNWYPESPNLTFAHNIISPFEDLSHPQIVPWGQDSDLFTILTSNTNSIDFPFPNLGYGVNISGNGSPKAGWCKIRAAVMWKIVRRNAAARRKGMFPFRYY